MFIWKRSLTILPVFAKKKNVCQLLAGWNTQHCFLDLDKMFPNIWDQTIVFSNLIQVLVQLSKWMPTELKYFHFFLSTYANGCWLMNFFGEQNCFSILHRLFMNQLRQKYAGWWLNESRTVLIYFYLRSKIVSQFLEYTSFITLRNVASSFWRTKIVSQFLIFELIKFSCAVFFGD